MCLEKSPVVSTVRLPHILGKGITQLSAIDIHAFRMFATEFGVEQRGIPRRVPDNATTGGMVLVK